MNKNNGQAPPSKSIHLYIFTIAKINTIETGFNVDDEEGRNLKKPRIAFTLWQSFELERRFRANKYLSSNQNAELAFSLSVTQQQVNLSFEPKIIALIN